jgi:transcriptional regulator with XRE-family HTH domain
MINGAALREIRIRTGLSVAALAVDVGVSRPYIARLELGHSLRVSPQVYDAILRALMIIDRRALLAAPDPDLAVAS